MLKAKLQKLPLNLDRDPLIFKKIKNHHTAELPKDV